MRPKVFATLFIALLAALMICAGDNASAQKRGAQANNNASQAQQKNERQKRVFVGRGTDSAQGSRVSIKSDDTLKDYSAYRSGDRFYVVLPKTDAGSLPKGGSGKGYSDMQVQQRGNDVVVSYRVQPGAKPRVEQKFNRLDVVFDVAGGGEQSNAQGNNPSTSTNTPPANQNPTAPNQNQNQQAQTATTNPPVGRPPAQPSGNPTQTSTGATSATPPPVANSEPAGNAGQTTPEGAQTSATEQPVASPTFEQQLASANPPTTIAPITTSNPATGVQPASTLGTYLLQNWWMALVLALAVVGLGLIIAARRNSAASTAALEESKNATADALKESRATELKAVTQADTTKVATQVDSSAVEAKSATTLKPVATVAGVTARESKNAKKKLKKRGGKAAKRKGASGVELPVVAEPSVEAVAAEESAVLEPVVTESEVAEPIETAAVEQTVVEEASVEPFVEELVEPIAEETSVETVVEETFVETPFEETSVEPVSEEANAEQVAEPVALGSVVEEVFVEDAPAVEPPVEIPDQVEEVAEVESAQEIEDGSVVTEIVPAAMLIDVAEEESAPSETGIAPINALDPDNVQAEARRVLQGEDYDESVVGSTDSMARQMIAAELLSALAGRNPERRERARAAFVRHGYFDEKVRDLKDAEAPAERAAAARSLAIVGDAAASPYLITALEDKSVDVRRAAVEALGALRDPAAVEPLEALLERERKLRINIPPRVIRNAIQTSREAAEEMRAAQARTDVQPPSVEVAQPVAQAFEERIAEESSVAETMADEPVADETMAIEPVFEEETVVAEALPSVEVAHEVLEEEVTVESSPVEMAHDEVSTLEQAAVEEVTVEVEPLKETEIARFEETTTLEGESREFVEPQAEPEAVTHFYEEVAVEQERGIEPSAELESAVSEFVEPAVIETAAPDSELSESNAVTQVAPFYEASTEIESVVESIEPPVKAHAESHAESDVGLADEWFDLDVHEASFGDSPTQVESTSAIEPSGQMFEPSADEKETSTIEFVLASPTIEETREVEPSEKGVEESFAPAQSEATAPAADYAEKGVAPFDELSTVPAAIQHRLQSSDARERAAAITELSHVDSDEAFQQICTAFDDEAKEVRSAAARALYELRTDRAESFTRALREATAERRRQIGSAISTSGLASEAISQLTGESRDKTYEAFSLLFLMAKAGEVQPLIRAIEGHPNNEVRLAVVKLLALSGQKEILPAFRRLAVRGSLPTEVRSAVMEAIYQISSTQPSAA